MSYDLIVIEVPVYDASQPKLLSDFTGMILVSFLLLPKPKCRRLYCTCVNPISILSR